LKWKKEATADTPTKIVMRIIDHATRDPWLKSGFPATIEPLEEAYKEDAMSHLAAAVAMAVLRPDS
jgi:hypothetical protein